MSGARKYALRRVRQRLLSELKLANQILTAEGFSKHRRKAINTAVGSLKNVVKPKQLHAKKDKPWSDLIFGLQLQRTRRLAKAYPDHDEMVKALDVALVLFGLE